MAITSNYKVQTSALSSSEVGVLPQKETHTHRSPWLTILGWVTTAAEIVATLLIPESAPIWVPLAISTTGAGVQTGIMSASGEFSAVGLAINWGATIIPFGSQLAKVAAKEARITNLAEKLLVEEADLAKLIKAEDFKTLEPLLQTASDVEKKTIIKKYLSQTGVSEELTARLEGRFTGADSQEIRRLLSGVFGDKKVDELIKSIKGLPKEQQNSLVMAFVREELGAEKANAFLKQMRKLYDDPKKAQRAAKLEIRNQSAFKKTMHYTGTSEFNDKVVQRVQAIFDPSDFGRKWIEDSYRVLKRKFRKAFSRAGKVLDKLEDMERAYVQTGGHLVNGTEIIGYKVLRTVGHRSYIMINFNPAKWDMGGTGAKNMIWKGRYTKNFGGKKPVFVWARPDELAMLVSNGMEYYLDKWAYSRGGLVVGTGLFSNIFRGLDITVLPFVNTGMLRNLLSLTSNIVERSYSMSVKHDYWFTEEWRKQAWRSFKRTGVSRVGRLFAQGVVRPVIGGRVGYIIGREVQRILGATSTAINNNKLGGKSTFGKQFLSSYKSKAMGGIISYANMPGRKRGLYSANKRNASRKLGFLRRPLSAVTPDAVFNPRKFGRIKF